MRANQVYACGTCGVKASVFPMGFRDKGVLMVDLQGAVQFANSYFCDLLQIPHDQPSGGSCFDCVFPEDAWEAMKLFTESKKAEPKPIRFRLKRQDGSPVWVDIQPSAMQTADGVMYGVFATV